MVRVAKAAVFVAGKLPARNAFQDRKRRYEEREIMNSNPGTHNSMAGLEKEVHRSTDRVHSEKAGTSISQNGGAATRCLAQLYVRGYPLSPACTESSLRQKRVLVNFEWGTLVEKYQCKGLSLGCCMLHPTLVGELCPKSGRCHILAIIMLMAIMEQGLSGDPCYFSYHI